MYIEHPQDVLQAAWFGLNNYRNLAETKLSGAFPPPLAINKDITSANGFFVNGKGHQDPDSTDRCR
jgi:hypothetical protein